MDIEQHFEEAASEEEVSEKEVLYETLNERLKNDPHWQEIDRGRLEDEDITLLQKFSSGELTEEEVKERARKLDDDGRIAPEDASADLAGMLRNKILSEEYFKRHPKSGADGIPMQSA